MDAPDTSHLRDAATSKLKFNCAQFPNMSSLNKYLEEEASLDVYETRIAVTDICLFKSILYDAFDFPFLVNRNFMIFPVNNGYTSLYRST